MNKNIKQFCINEELFYPKVKALLKHASPKQYALVALDFDNFNFVNDMFGFIAGDKILTKLEARFASFMREGEFFSRAHADHFMFFIQLTVDELIIDRFTQITSFGNLLLEVLPEHYTFVCSGGIVIIDDPAERLTSLLDKANFSRKKAKGNHNNTFLYYDKETSEELSWKKKITLWMHSALNNKEFEMYLQPKIDLTNGEIIGAEALSRWNSPALGLIMPAKFIPVFEQNGFVKVLDFFILEQACLFINRCKNEGHKIIPISVNFSKLHIRSQDFAQQVFNVVHNLNVPTSLIEIEFTESAFSSDYNNIIDTAQNLLQYGFSVSLDDFGTGYSSLNNLKNIPINVIKIDRGFLVDSSINKKGLIVLSKIVELTKALQIKTVIEGVETPKHLEIAKSVGCDIAQGFYYARPLTITDFINFVSKGQMRIAQQTAYIEPHIYDLQVKTDADRWDSYNICNEIDYAIVKVYLDKDSTVQFINKKALDIIGYTREEMRDLFDDDIRRVLTAQYCNVLENNAYSLLEGKGHLSCTIALMKKDGTSVLVNIRSSYTEDANGRPMAVYVYREAMPEYNLDTAYSSNEKIAELEIAISTTVEQNKELHEACEKYSLALSMSDDVNYDWSLEQDVITFSKNYENVFHRSPITNNISTISALISRVHPDDIEFITEWRDETLQGNNINHIELRMQSANGEYVWIRIRGTIIFDNRGCAKRAIGIFTNIDYIKTEFELLRKKSQLDPLTLIYNKAELTRRITQFIASSPTVQGALFIIDIDNFKGVNDNLGHQFGDNVLRQTADKIKAVFGKHCIVGRLGGDEFTVFYYGNCSEDNMPSLCLSLINGLRKTYYGENMMYSISCSAGIALFPHHSRSYDELYHLSDIALYTAKRMGKDCCQIYDQSMLMDTNSSLTPLDTKNLFLNDYFQGDPIYNIFEMLYETKDLKTTIDQILELLGQRFGVDRVYIFQHSDDGTHTSNTYEWCAQGISPEKDSLQNIPVSVISVFLSLFNSEGLNVCSDISVLSKSDFEILDPQGIKALLQCEIHSDGKSVGFIGFDDCTSTREWRGEMIASIGYASRILSVFLTKNRVTRDLIESQTTYEKMIYNLNGYVYVINMDSYDLLYINKHMEALDIAVGEKCYMAAFGADIPCANCPARRLSEENPFAKEEIYSVKLDTWVDSAASLLSLSNKKRVALIYCTKLNRHI